MRYTHPASHAVNTMQLVIMMFPLCLCTNI